MKLAKVSYAMVACLSLATASVSFAQESEKEEQSSQQKSSEQSKEGKLSAMDKAWVQMAALADKAEIQLSKAAEEKASNDRVKQFAKMMVDEHTKSSQELQKIAKEKNIDLKDELPQEKQRLLKEITSKSGEEFDQAYMDHQLAGHRMAVAHYQNGADLLKDQELQSFAQKTLPNIQKHLSMLEQQGTRSTTQRQQPAQPGSSTVGSQPQPQTQPGQQPSGQVGTQPQQQ